MNERQRKFVDEYILTGNASESARRAGYSAKTAGSIGERLLKNVEVRAALDERIKAASTEKTLTQSQLLEFLSAVVKGEVFDQQLMTRLIGKGCSVIENVEIRASVQNRIRAAELLLKIQGAFKEVDQQNNSANLFVETLEKIWQDNHGNEQDE